MNAFLTRSNRFRIGSAFGIPSGGPPPDPIADIPFVERLQTHRGDKVPLGLYKDTACTIPATLDGDSVAAWKDEINLSGLIAIQSNALQRPTLRFRSGTPVLNFDGVDDHLLLGTLISNTIRTICTAQRSTDITTFRAIVDDSNVNCYVGQNNTNQGIVIDSIGALRAATALSTNWEAWTAYYFLGAPGELHLRMAGVDTLLVTGVTFGSTGSMIIGRAGNASAAWMGDIVAVMCANNSVSMPNIVRVETYLNSLMP